MMTDSAKASKLLDGSSEFVLTYEDKDGDWMLVGDVPWGYVRYVACLLLDMLDEFAMIQSKLQGVCMHQSNHQILVCFGNWS